MPLKRVLITKENKRRREYVAIACSVTDGMACSRAGVFIRGQSVRCTGRLRQGLKLLQLAQ